VGYASNPVECYCRGSLHQTSRWRHQTRDWRHWIGRWRHRISLSVVIDLGKG